jgi:hypothetical protein
MENEDINKSMEESTSPPKAKAVSAVFAMGNKCYTGRDAIHQKITEQNETTEGMLVLRLNEGRGSFVLKLCGAELNDSEETLNDRKIFTLNLTFLVKDIQSWGSHPMKPGRSLSKSFNAPVGHITTADEPKRFIHFQAKSCQLAKEIPRLQDPDLEARMKELVARVRDYMLEGRVMYFKCVVDEYRTDRGVFKSIEESVEAEKPQCCNRCQKTGHRGTECGEPQCGRCKVVGHNDNSCPSLLCRGCGTRGHSVQQCPQRLVCTKCWKKGHTEEACTETDNPDHEKKRKERQPGSVDLHALEFVEGGRSLDAAFTFNGRLYKWPKLINEKNREVVIPKLFLHFADYPCFSSIHPFSLSRIFSLPRFCSFGLPELCFIFIGS